MDISGKWSYKEDFGFGKSEGTVDFVQAGDEVIGHFIFTESVDDEYVIDVSEKVKGTMKVGKLLLQSFEVEALENDKKVEYSPNTFEIQLISANKMVGSTYDIEGVCGVFVLERES